MKRRNLFGMGIAAALVLAAGAVVVAAPWQSDSETAPSSELVRVQKTSFEITTNATGELEAKEQIEIRSQVETASSIVEIVPEGSIVAKGDVLVRLNTASLQDQIDEEMVRVESALADVEAADNALKIQLSENDSRLRAGQMRVELADLALKQWRDGDVQKRRTELQLAIEQAERQLRRLRDRYERSEELLKEGFVSQNERDLDEIAMIDAQARLSTAILDQRVYNEYQYPRDQKGKLNEVEEAKAELDRIIKQNQINLSSRESALSTRQRTYELRSGKLEKLQEQMELATIRAPSAGLVVYASSMQNNRNWGGNEGPLQIGSNVRPNDLLMVLPDTSEMVAAVRVHESLAGRIRPGQDALVKIDAAGGRSFPGTVSSIGVLAETGGWRDPNRREYTVRVSLSGGQGQSELKPSMRAEAVITLGDVDNVMAVPVQAVFNDGAIRYVYTPQGNGFVRTPVGLGRRSDTMAEITAGLTESNRVLVRQPKPNEIVEVTWQPEMLKAAGYALDDEGRVIQQRPQRIGRSPRPEAPTTPPAVAADALSNEHSIPEASSSESSADSTIESAETITEVAANADGTSAQAQSSNRELPTSAESVAQEASDTKPPVSAESAETEKTTPVAAAGGA